MLLRRGLTVWLRETTDVVEAAEKSLQTYPHRNFSSSSAARNLERAAAESSRSEEKLIELNRTVANLTARLEVGSNFFLVT